MLKYTRFFLLITVAASLCLASNCKKLPKDGPPIDLGSRFLDSSFKRYWAFKEGSYWVYENKKNGKNGVVGILDTIKCTYFEHNIIKRSTNYWIFNTDDYYFIHEHVNKDEYGNTGSLEYTTSGSTGLTKDTFRLHSWTMRCAVNKPFGGINTCFEYPYISALKEHVRYLSDTTINGHNYKDVIVMYTYPDQQMPDRLSIHATFTYWAKDVGILRYCTSPGSSSDIWDFQLKEYNVIKE